MKKTIIQTINSCDDCQFYEYVRCYGYDCSHSDAPPIEKRGDEELAENSENDYPKWCPIK